MTGGIYLPGPDGRLDVQIAAAVIDEIYGSIGRRPAETGGILLGPTGRNGVVTGFHFDSSAKCGGVTYTPDVATLRRLMKEVWLPAGLDMKGFAHSHPAGFDRLSAGDLQYVRRLMKANPDMDRFIAPILIPDEFRMVVHVFVSDAGPQFGRVTII